MSLEQLLRQAPVIPVLIIDELRHAVPLAKALVAGGLPVLEITLRTPVALDAIRSIAQEVEGAIVGVGTVIEPRQLSDSLNAGAQFAVSPGLTPALVSASHDHDIPLLPGVFTPGEVLRARDEGFNLLKLFPAAQAGGIGMLRALGSPIPDVKFCPTGGISADSFVDYLKLANVICVGGSWVAPADKVAAEDWDSIRTLAQQAVDAVADLPR